MKRILLLLIFLIPVLVFGQIKKQVIGTGFNEVDVANDLYTIGVTYLGVHDTTFTPRQTGAMVTRPQDNLLYYFISRSGQRWFSVQMGIPVFTGTGSGVNFQIGIGSTVSIPNATSVSAGIIDTARIRYIDSLRNGLKKSSIVIGHPGAGKWIGYPSNAGDSLYLKNFTNGKYTTVVTNTDSSNETDVDTAGLRILFNNAYLPKTNTITINGSTQNLSGNPAFTVSTGAGTVKSIITQSNTGLSVNMPVYVNSSGVWVAADTINFAMGVVDSLISTTGFEVTFDGLYHAAAHGLTVGSYYYVTMPGGSISTISPNKSQPVLIPVDANNVLVRLYRPNNFGLALSPQIDTTGIVNGGIPVWSTSLGHFVAGVPATITAGPGLKAAGGNTISWGSNPFTGADTTATAGNPWVWLGIPSRLPQGTDSAIMLSGANQVYKTGPVSTVVKQGDITGTSTGFCGGAAAYTTPSDGKTHQYVIYAYINVTAYTSGGGIVTIISWTDENNNSRSQNLILYGTGSTSGVTSVGSYNYIPITIYTKAGSTISLCTGGIDPQPEVITFDQGFSFSQIR